MTSAADDEGSSFTSAFAGLFGSKVNTSERLKAERRAAMSPKQRARKAVRVVQINFRASTDTKARLDALAAKLDASAADVLERALEMLAKEEGLP